MVKKEAAFLKAISKWKTKDLEDPKAGGPPRYNHP